MSKISYIIVNIEQQQLTCFDQDKSPLVSYSVSTSMYGVGNQNGSFKTPLGKHSIAQKIGEGCAINEVFVGRKPIGILDDLLKQNKPIPKDVISSRILWLRGETVGLNKRADNAGTNKADVKKANAKGVNAKGANVKREGANASDESESVIDSYQRYIYIHGTSEENKIGQPASHGCVRMRNKDVIELFDLVEEGCTVLIDE